MVLGSTGHYHGPMVRFLEEHGYAYVSMWDGSAGGINENRGSNFLKGLHHVEIYVSNVARSTEFWGWFLTELGYVPFQEWDAGRSWRLNDTYLVFVQALDRHADVPYHRGRVGVNHVALWAESRDQVNVLTEQVRSRGLRVLYEDRHPLAGGPDHYALYFEDPDRIKVELVAP